MRRIWNMVHATVDRDANRLMICLAPAFYLLAECLILLILNSRAPRGIQVGAIHFRIHFVVSLALLCFVTIRVSSDVLGMREGEWRDLLKLTGISAWHWIGMRWWQVVFCLGIVWLIRLPLLLLFVTLGGVTFDSIMIGELLLLTLCLTMGAVSLLASFSSQTRGQVVGMCASLIVGVEALLYIPGKLFSYNYMAPLVTPSLLTFADAIRDFRITPQLLTVLMRTSRYADLLKPMLLYLVVALVMVIWLRVLLFRVSCDSPITTVKTITSKVVERPQRRPSIRCWDDALAWQSFQFHIGGKPTEFAKFLGLIAMLALIGVFMAYGMFQDIWGMFAVAGPVTLINGVGQVGTCLEKEVKANTMSTLMLTPHTNVEFYLGWQRGVWKALKVEWAACGISFLIAAAFNFEMAIAVLAAILSVTASTPFFTLATLVPMTPKGIPTSILVVFFLVLFVILSIVIGAMTNPIVGSAFAVLSLWGFNAFVYHKLLPSWLEYKMSGALKDF